jgi:hypothetical protein
MDSMGLLNLIRKLAYTGGTNYFDTKTQCSSGEHQLDELTPRQVPDHPRLPRPVPGNEEGVQCTRTMFWQMKK